MYLISHIIIKHELYHTFVSEVSSPRAKRERISRSRGLTVTDGKAIASLTAFVRTLLGERYVRRI